MQRKPGGYRSPSVPTRVLSVISAENHRMWFQQIWSGLTGASTKHHPAPYPLELADRLVRMFSFVGDTVLDPFGGTGTTTLAASCLILSSRETGPNGDYREPDRQLSFKLFATSLVAHAITFAKLRS